MSKTPKTASNSNINTPESPVSVNNSDGSDGILGFQISEKYINPAIIRKRLRYYASVEASNATAAKSGQPDSHSLLSNIQIENSIIKLQACSFLYSLSINMQFPHRTLAAAMMFLHRFTLCHSVKELPFHEVAVACLYVAAKTEDTTKKIRDFLVPSYAIRYPTRAVPNIDSSFFEEQKKFILRIERMLLENCSFDFRLEFAFPHIIKMTRALLWNIDDAHLAWLASIDIYRTLAPLKVNPQSLACACILVISAIQQRLDSVLISKFKCDGILVQVALHDLLELYINHRQYTILNSKLNDKQDFLSLRMDLHKFRWLDTDHPKIRKLLDDDPENPVDDEKEISCNDISKIGEKGVIRFFLDYDRKRRWMEINKLTQSGLTVEVSD